MNNSFQRFADYFKENRDRIHQSYKGLFFESAIRRVLLEHDLLDGQPRFQKIDFWSDWSKDRPQYSNQDTGVDLVADLGGGSVLCDPMQVL